MIELLGTWYPEEITKETWVEKLRTLFSTDQVDLFRTAEIRSPEDHLSGGICTGPTEEWHQDMNGEDYWIIVWASRYPTELKDIDNTMRALDVWMFDNTKYEHRTPLEARNSDRWFAKCVISKKDMKCLMNIPN